MDTIFFEKPVVAHHLHVYDADQARNDTLSNALRDMGFSVQSSYSPGAFRLHNNNSKVSAAIISVDPEEAAPLAVAREFRSAHPTKPLIIELPANHPELGQGLSSLCVTSVHHHSGSLERLVADLRSALSAAAPPKLETAIGLARLTSRERQILAMIVDGMTSKEAGRILDLSPRTVEVHRASLLTKMQAKNTADLMRKVLQIAFSGFERGSAPPIG